MTNGLHNKEITFTPNIYFEFSYKMITSVKPSISICCYLNLVWIIFGKYRLDTVRVGVPLSLVSIPDGRHRLSKAILIGFACKTLVLRVYALIASASGIRWCGRSRLKAAVTKVQKMKPAGVEPLNPAFKDRRSSPYAIILAESRFSSVVQDTTSIFNTRDFHVTFRAFLCARLKCVFNLNGRLKHMFLGHRNALLPVSHLFKCVTRCCVTRNGMLRKLHIISNGVFILSVLAIPIMTALPPQYRVD
ncbi:uncharacterized protein EV154DRAFT_486997 [Mucor mucedo]|uniref:uncharacterized protein n=1 Tax=Mucor mucedo TaxID=29922 RepID=UPI00221F5C90|nr:uncharacterized protein EV154DRAFT_486997 [Mucor mucedo]KAI7874001.1 hypothetical protein EV154DRAFT_486997 [Mucor mucedo]